MLLTDMSCTIAGFRYNVRHNTGLETKSWACHYCSALCGHHELTMPLTCIEAELPLQDWVRSLIYRCGLASYHVSWVHLQCLCVSESAPVLLSVG